MNEETKISEANQEFRCPNCGEISRLWALREIGKCDNAFCQTPAEDFIKVEK